MKSTTEQQLTDCIEMEYSYLNLLDCHVLNEKLLYEHLGDKWQSVDSFVATPTW